MKIKTCPHCQKVLYCKACGQRVTPERKNLRTEMAGVYLTPEQKERFRKEAEQRGMSLSDYLAHVVESKASGEEPFADEESEEN